MVILMEELGVDVPTETPEGYPVPKPNLQIHDKHQDNCIKNNKLTEKHKEDIFKNVLKDQKVSMVFSFLFKIQLTFQVESTQCSKIFDFKT